MMKFKTLLQREWMQHQIGWTVVLTLPAALALLLVLFGHLPWEKMMHEAEMPGRASATLLTAMVIMALMGLTAALAWIAAGLQVSGLARRDQQDRSIEFWLSLPTSHLQSLGATLLMHLLLVPAAAVLSGTIGGWLVAMVASSQAFGVGSLASMQWGSLLLWSATLSLGFMIELMLFTLWMSPLLLIVMVASAWFKRWGIAVATAAITIPGAVLDKLYGSTIVWDVLQRLLLSAISSFGPPGHNTLNIGPNTDLAELLIDTPGRMWTTTLNALAALASPDFAAVVLVSAACVALLVLRRQRGA